MSAPPTSRGRHDCQDCAFEAGTPRVNLRTEGGSWTPGCTVSCVSPALCVGPTGTPCWGSQPSARCRGEDTVVLRRGEATGEESAPSGRSGKVGADCTPWRTHSEAVPGVVVAPAVDAPVFAASLPPQHSCCPHFRDGDTEARSSFSCRVGTGKPPSHRPPVGSALGPGLRPGPALAPRGRACGRSFPPRRAGPPATGPTVSADRGSAPDRRSSEVTYRHVLWALQSWTPPQCCARGPMPVPASDPSSC